MSVLLISTYDLGRQPLGLASPAARLRDAGVEVCAIDTSRQPLLDEEIAHANLIAFFLPMHTATRLAMPLVERIRGLNPAAALAAYGLYAPLNAAWLRAHGVQHVLGPEEEQGLVSLALAQGALHNAQCTTLDPGRVLSSQSVKSKAREFVLPHRSSLLPLQRYAALQMPDGTRRVVGNSDATRGCKHLCRHCPIVPVYQGTFRAVPLDLVIEDVRAQVSRGAEHITFGDPDFFNGPTHARRLIERFAREFPHTTYDATIKVEHLLKHREMLPLLRQTGCLFVTSAVESVDDEVLEKLAKGHTRADFIRAVQACREAGVALAPTFVPFTPWTTVEGYGELLTVIEELDLINEVAPIQLAIRLLVTAESRLLELGDIRASVDAFDPASLMWPWRHRDGAVDALQRDVMAIVSERARSSRAEIFAAIRSRAIGGSATPHSVPASVPPYMTEAWYCCAEPSPDPLSPVGFGEAGLV